MPFTVGNIVAKDGDGDLIGGGMLAGDVAGGGVGPHFLFHGVVDGIAGSNKLGVYAEDSAADSNPTGLMMMAVRRDTLSAGEVSADNDNIALKATDKGELRVNDADAAASLASLVSGALSYGTPAAPASTILSVQGPQGDTSARLLSSAASTNATSVKGSAGRARSFNGKNNRTTPVYLKFYNKATSPTIGTDTPVLTIELAASSYFNEVLDFYFATGIGYGLTSAAADADTGAVAAGDITVFNLIYQ